jgi:hypothetical protein
MSWLYAAANPGRPGPARQNPGTSLEAEAMIFLLR